MTGQIPPYGAHFRLVRLPYSAEMANRKYEMKADTRWYIRSDKTSHKWWVFINDVKIGTPVLTLTLAMQKARRLYSTATPINWGGNNVNG